MQTTYESESPDASSDRLIHAITDEYSGLKPIETLDEYIHYKTQLMEMRKRSPDYIPESFAMELAVLFLLNDYERKIGVPELGLPCETLTPAQRIAPEDWVEWRDDE